MNTPAIPTRARRTRLLAGFGLALMLTGCGGSGYQGAVVSRAAAAEGAPFVLPPGLDGGTSGDAWDQGLVICPYDNVADLPTGFREAGESIDTEAHESRAWMLLAADQNIETVSLDRATIDFCGSGSDFGLFYPETEWEASERGGTWVVGRSGTDAADAEG